LRERIFLLHGGEKEGPIRRSATKTDGRVRGCLELRTIITLSMVGLDPTTQTFNFGAA